MAQYAELYFAKQEDDIPINKYLMKLPDNMRNQIIKWKPTLEYKDSVTWGIQGAEIQMPLTYTMYRKMPGLLRKQIFKKIEKKLQKREITHVILPNTMKTFPFENMKKCTGNDIKPFFMMEMIDFLTKENIVGKDLQDVEVIILDGNTKDVDIMIDFIYPYINHLTIISKSPDRFKEKAEIILEDVGLNMQVLSYTKGAISQGDIIIDTHYDDPSIIGFCKAGALYLDIGNHIEKTNMLLERRRKAQVIDQFLLIKNNQVASLAKAEALLDLGTLFSRNYKETMKRIKEEKVKVYKFVK